VNLRGIFLSSVVEQHKNQVGEDKTRPLELQEKFIDEYITNGMQKLMDNESYGCFKVSYSTFSHMSNISCDL